MTTDRSRRIAPHQRRSSKDRLQRQSHRADRLQSPTTHTSIDHTAPITQRSTPTPLNLFSTARSDEFFFWALFLLCFCMTGFDDFFFLGFVSFMFPYWGMILYICLAVEKMCATSIKCVFYGIFKNTTKHQKIFFKTFFEMQPNTYFPFPEIAFLENILHKPNTA